MWHISTYTTDSGMLYDRFPDATRSPGGPGSDAFGDIPKKGEIIRPAAARSSPPWRPHEPKKGFCAQQSAFPWQVPPQKGLWHPVGYP
jgi:hypothetical protein